LYGQIENNFFNLLTRYPKRGKEKKRKEKLSGEKVE